MKHEFIIEKSNHLKFGFSELFQFRELLFYFSWRDIKVKYKETTLGIAWVVMQPLLMTALFSLIFSKGLKIYASTLPYPVFVLSGLVLWYFVSGCLSNAANSMELNANIIRKIYFPRLVIPVSSVLTSAFDLVFGLAVLVPICSYYDVQISLINLCIALPLSLFILTLSSMGVACLLSILNAIFKDFRYIIPFFIQVLFFTCPVFYDLKMLGDGWWSELFTWNPVSGGIQIFRTIFSDLPFPWFIIIKPLFASLITFIAGFMIFKKLEQNLADLI